MTLPQDEPEQDRDEQHGGDRGDPEDPRLAVDRVGRGAGRALRSVADRLLHVGEQRADGYGGSGREDHESHDEDEQAVQESVGGVHQDTVPFSDRRTRARRAGR